MIPFPETKNTKYFEWTPQLSCLTESEAPTVEYTRQLRLWLQNQII